MRPWRSSLLLAAASLLVFSASASQATVETSPGKAVTAADFAHEKFERPTAIDNKWLPLKPGTELVFEGTTVDGKKTVSHRIVSTVTDLTKVIAGVRTVVVWDRDFSGGELVEAELAFFAQDDDGNVWELGEYPEEYEGRKVVDNPAWIHGIERARAGIAMKAEPRPGAPSYSLGWGPAVGFNDRAEVRKAGQTTCVPVRCYRNVLEVAEFNPGEPGRYQLKYYAPGVGNVRVGWAGAKETSKEILVLAKVAHLGGTALKKARGEALKLERHGYRISKAVYGRTPPARRLSA